METRVLKVGCEVLAFVFNMMPQNAQWPGDTKDGVQVIVENQHSRLAEQFGWHTDKAKSSTHLNIFMIPLDLRMETVASVERPWMLLEEARPKMAQFSIQIIPFHITATYSLCLGAKFLYACLMSRVAA